MEDKSGAQRGLEIVKCLNLYNSEQPECPLVPETTIRRSFEPARPRNRGNLILAYRILHGSLPSLSTTFQMNEDTRLRGHNFKLKKEHFRTTKRQNFIVNRVFSAWNNLDADTVDAPSVSIFKSPLDRLILYKII
ncbi:hypothetical protein JTB14_015679 [Gonioctena quinquepunctata]|nr:hypothetical protein JTB14_015679 [Gonioctena quinquepunctata]